MVASAALRVGIHKAIEGEGYDLDNMDTLVDGVGAAIEGGLFIVGNIGAAKLMQDLQTQYAGSIGSTVEQAWRGRQADLAGGLEGTIDEASVARRGSVPRLVSDQTWSGDLGNAFSNISASTLLHGSLGGGMGFAGGSLFKSIGETFGPAARKMLGGNKSLGEAAGRRHCRRHHGSHARRPRGQLAGPTSPGRGGLRDQPAHAGDLRRHHVEFGLKRSLVGLKGNDFGLEDVTKVDKDEFIEEGAREDPSLGRPEASVRCAT